MTTPATTVFSHVGICVTDLDRSLRFYCDGLGFEQGESIPIDDTFGAALEVPGELSLTSSSSGARDWPSSCSTTSPPPRLANRRNDGTNWA